MNTIFKFYLEAWFLFAAASAAAAVDLWQGLHPLAAAAAQLAGRPGRAARAGAVHRRHRRVGGGEHQPRADAAADAGRHRLPAAARAARPRRVRVDERQHRRHSGHRRGVRAVVPGVHPRGDEHRAADRAGLGLPRVASAPSAGPTSTSARTTSRSSTPPTTSRPPPRSCASTTSRWSTSARSSAAPTTAATLERFKQWTDLLQPVYSNAGTTIFAVQGQFAGAIPVNTIEEVPQVAEEEAAPSQGAPGQLSQPRGVAVDAEGNSYVADFGNDRIAEVRPAAWSSSRHGASAATWRHQFKQPGDVAIGPDGLSTSPTPGISACRCSRRTANTSASGRTSTTGRAASRWRRAARSIWPTPATTAYASSTREGVEQLTWGGLGKEPGQFTEPVGIAVGKDGAVYVVDNGNARLQIFDPNGKLIGGFPVEGWEQKVFSEPHVTLAPDGTIWVSIPTLRVIRAYDRSGKTAAGDQGRRRSQAAVRSADGPRLRPAHQRAGGRRSREPHRARKAVARPWGRGRLARWRHGRAARRSRRARDRGRLARCARRSPQGEFDTRSRFCRVEGCERPAGHRQRASRPRSQAGLQQSGGAAINCLRRAASYGRSPHADSCGTVLACLDR